MLNSTKTWQDELQQVVYNQEMKPEYRVLFQHRLEQLIMDIRKKDEQQLLLKLSLETQYYGREIEMKISKIIEEYYAK